MLGRRNPQRSLFEAQAWPHGVPADSFYARLGGVIEQLFTDPHSPCSWGHALSRYRWRIPYGRLSLEPGGAVALARFRE
jgi:hypothetical protein